jgi:hypothetical protein
LKPEDFVGVDKTNYWRGGDLCEPLGERKKEMSEKLPTVLVETNVEAGERIVAALYSDLAVDVMNTPEFEIIRSAPNGPLSGMLAQQLAEQFETSVDKVMAIVRAQVDAVEGGGSQSTEPDIDERDLATEEWKSCPPC